MYDPKEHWSAKGKRGLIRDRRLGCGSEIDPDIEPELAHLASTLSRLEPAKILDVGSGWGFIYDYLSRSGLDMDYTACDFVDSMIELHARNTGLRPEKWDGETLPFGDGAFDFVLSYSVLIHVPPGDIEGVFSEHMRVSGRWFYVQGTREIAKPAPHCFNHDYAALFARFGVQVADELESIDGRRVNWLLRKGVELENTRV